MDKYLSGNQWRLHKAMFVFFVACYIVDTQRWETILLLTIVAGCWYIHYTTKPETISKEELVERLGTDMQNNP